MNLYELDTREWNAPLSQTYHLNLVTALEASQVIFLPKLSFAQEKDEQQFLTPTCLQEGSKNVSYNFLTGNLKGSSDKNSTLLKGLMHRFAVQSQMLINNLFPLYEKQLLWGRTSYRPAEILGRETSYRKDDSRLHIDAFPSLLTQGNRILRVFSNINPLKKPRVWLLGEPFDEVARKFLPQIHQPFPFSRRFFHLQK